MRWTDNTTWRRTATFLTALGIVIIVLIGATGRPVLAAYGFSLMLGLLGVYRLIDRQPNAWLAVRSWPKDCLTLFLLAILILVLAPYGGIVMPVSS